MVIFPILIATALGFLAGMGVGGGSLLLLWLTQIVKMDPAQARILNLLFFLPAALISSLFRFKHRSIDTRIVIPGMLAGCFAAAVLSMISQSIHTEVAKKLLGGLLIAMGVREVFYRERKAR